MKNKKDQRINLCWKCYCKTGSLLGYIVKGIVTRTEEEAKQKIKKQYGYKVTRLEKISIDDFLKLYSK